MKPRRTATTARRATVGVLAASVTLAMLATLALGAPPHAHALPTPDRDGDGVRDSDDLCPGDAEDRDGFQDVATPEEESKAAIRLREAPPMSVNSPPA